MKLGGILLLPLELGSQSGWKFENKEIETRLKETIVPQTVYFLFLEHNVFPQEFQRQAFLFILFTERNGQRSRK